MFQAPKGGPIRINQFRQRFWNPATTRAGLNGLWLHGLRHTAVALWIHAGASPTAVAARAGHRWVVTVLDRYGHLFASSGEQLNERLDALYAAAVDEAAATGQVIDFGR